MKKMKKVASLAIVFATLCLTACGGTQSQENPAESDASQQNDVQLTPSPTGLHHLGERAEGDGFALTVDSVDATPEYLNYDPADDEMTFFFISFELENTSDQPLDLGSFFTISADGAECELIQFGDPYNSVEWLDQYTELDGGRKIKNYISAVVPEDWEEVQLICEDGTTFAFTRDDLGDISADEMSGNEAEVSHIGDTIVRNGMNITLTSAMQTDYVSYLSTMYYEPDPGYHFIVLFFDIQNVSSQAQQFEIYSAFDLYVDDYSSNFTGLSADINGVDDLSDQDYIDIAPGKSISGYKVIEVPDGWQIIELIGRQGSFEITPDEVPIQ